MALPHKVCEVVFICLCSSRNQKQQISVLRLSCSHISDQYVNISVYYLLLTPLNWAFEICYRALT